jgi:DNA repair protein RecO (recombination protein O)
MAQEPQTGRLREYHVMLKRSEGIVLRTFPFGEADLIVTYLTLDSGLVKLFAKSPRKFKSRFGSSLEPLTHSRISFWGREDTALPKLTQSDIISPFQSIRDNLSKFLKVSEIIELTINFIPERDVNKKVYTLLLNTLQAIESNSPSASLSKGGKGGFVDEDLMVNHYKIKFLQLVGFAPRLDSCGRCGKIGYRFYISQGSILCELCAKGIDSPISISPAALRFYTDLLTWDTSKVNRIRPSEMLLLELSDIINMHIKYILSKPLKSETFLHSLSR